MRAHAFMNHAKFVFYFSFFFSCYAIWKLCFYVLRNFVFKACENEWKNKKPPTWTKNTFMQHKKSNTLLCLTALDKARIPTRPIRFPFIRNCSKDLWYINALDRTTAPSSPISFSPKFNLVKVWFTLIASANVVTNTSPKWFPSNSNSTRTLLLIKAS